MKFRNVLSVDQILNSLHIKRQEGGTEDNFYTPFTTLENTFKHAHADNLET